MVRHVVFLKWKEGTSDAQISAVEEALAGMPAVMPFIRRYEMGRDLGIAGSHDFAVVADFDDADGYVAYAGNPDHQAVVSTFISPILDSLARVQYTL